MRAKQFIISQLVKFDSLILINETLCFTEDKEKNEDERTEKAEIRPIS